MKKIIDVSAYQGEIDFAGVAQECDHVILRTTTQNGNIDTRFMENLNGCLQSSIETIDGYKFAYAKGYIPAYMEACKTFDTLQELNALRFLNRFWLDLEPIKGVTHTTEQANEIIKGYRDAAQDFNVPLGLYFNYSYAKHVIDSYWCILPIWLARYNKEMGDVSPFTPLLWQYTGSGTCAGIKGNVDVSMEIE